MNKQIEVDARTLAPENNDGAVREIAFDIAYQTHLMVNVVYCAQRGAGDRRWVLVDSGLSSSGPNIRRTAEWRFGEGARPAAIILTHGHFDHVGAVCGLARDWETPIYAHALEHPYLDGTREYPRPDSSAGGLMALLSPLFPRRPVDLRSPGLLRALPADGTIPEMPDWRWIHTPGHTPGHISLWREADRTLIAGDAFITTRQESAYYVATQRPEMHGPPQYFTPDWESAGESVRRLAALRPELVITGHGKPMRGPLMRAALDELADRFDDVAVPDSARRAARR